MGLQYAHSIMPSIYIHTHSGHPLLHSASTVRKKTFASVFVDTDSTLKLKPSMLSLAAEVGKSDHETITVTVT